MNEAVVNDEERKIMIRENQIMYERQLAKTPADSIEFDRRASGTELPSSSAPWPQPVL